MVYVVTFLLRAQSLLFHLQACPDEWTNTFGVVVADRLADVILETAITLEVWLLDVWTRAWTQTAYFAAACQTDSLVWINLIPQPIFR